MTPTGLIHNTSQGFFDRRKIPDRNNRISTAKSNASLHVSDHIAFRNHGQEIKQVQENWEGKIETEEFW